MATVEKADGTIIDTTTAPITQLNALQAAATKYINNHPTPPAAGTDARRVYDRHTNNKANITAEKADRNNRSATPSTPAPPTTSGATAPAPIKTRREARKALTAAKEEQANAAAARDEAQSKHDGLKTLSDTQTSIVKEQDALAEDQKSITELKDIHSRRGWVNWTRSMASKAGRAQIKDDKAAFKKIVGQKTRFTRGNMNIALAGLATQKATHQSSLNSYKADKQKQVTALQALGITDNLDTTAEVQAAFDQSLTTLNDAKTNVLKADDEVARIEQIQNDLKSQAKSTSMHWLRTAGIGIGVGLLAATALTPATAVLGGVAAAATVAGISSFGLDGIRGAASSLGENVLGIAKGETHLATWKLPKRALTAAALAGAVTLGATTVGTDMLKATGNGPDQANVVAGIPVSEMGEKVSEYATPVFETADGWIADASGWVSDQYQQYANAPDNNTLTPEQIAAAEAAGLDDRLANAEPDLAAQTATNTIPEGYIDPALAQAAADAAQATQTATNTIPEGYIDPALAQAAADAAQATQTATNTIPEGYIDPALAQAAADAAQAVAQAPEVSDVAPVISTSNYTGPDLTSVTNASFADTAMNTTAPIAPAIPAAATAVSVDTSTAINTELLQTSLEKLLDRDGTNDMRAVNDFVSAVGFENIDTFSHMILAEKVNGNGYKDFIGTASSVAAAEYLQANPQDYSGAFDIIANGAIADIPDQIDDTHATKSRIDAARKFVSSLDV